MSELISTHPDIKERLIGLALDGLASPHTRRAYAAALDEFLTWSQGQQPSVLCKALVNRYKAMLIEKGLAPATINQRLAAVRRLAQEAADNGLLEASAAIAISKVHGLRLYGVRIGIWLTSAGARELLGIPDSDSVRGKRDRAILASPARLWPSARRGCGRFGRAVPHSRRPVGHRRSGRQARPHSNRSGSFLGQGSGG